MAICILAGGCVWIKARALKLACWATRKQFLVHNRVRSNRSKEKGKIMEAQGFQCFLEAVSFVREPVSSCRRF